MGDYPNYINPNYPSPPRQGDNLPMLYYGLVVMGAAAALLVIYNLIIIRWCLTSHDERGESANAVARFSGSNWGSSFKYKKGDNKPDQLQSIDIEYECSVCLSVFEDGEEVRELPGCKHSFHSVCIDMWLYSHFECPLCRRRVEILPSHGLGISGGVA